MKTIGSQAFQGCQNLDYIEIPDTVTYLGRESFILCSKLKYVKLSKGLKVLAALRLKIVQALKVSVYQRELKQSIGMHLISVDD